MVVDYLSSQLDWAGYQVSTTWGSGPGDAAEDSDILQTANRNLTQPRWYEVSQ